MKRKMLQFSPELSEYLEEKVKQLSIHATKKKMFGHEVFFLNGYMFSGANVKGIFVHIGQETRDQALEKESSFSLFEPMEGMIMRDYLLLKEPIYSDDKKPLCLAAYSRGVKSRRTSSRRLTQVPFVEATRPG